MDNNTTKRKYSAEELKKYKKRSMWAEVWRNFKKNRTAMVGLFIVIALVIIAVFSHFYYDYNADIVHQ